MELPAPIMEALVRSCYRLGRLVKWTVTINAHHIATDYLYRAGLTTMDLSAFSQCVCEYVRNPVSFNEELNITLHLYRYANVTIGLPCILERTTYNGLDHNYLPYNITIQRDNCVTSYPKLYCGSNSSLCERMKELGDTCDDDRECLSVRETLSPQIYMTHPTIQLSCSEMNVCTSPPGGSLRVEVWQYALTASSGLIGMSMAMHYMQLS